MRRTARAAALGDFICTSETEVFNQRIRGEHLKERGFVPYDAKAESVPDY